MVALLFTALLSPPDPGIRIALIFDVFMALVAVNLMATLNSPSAEIELLVVKSIAPFGYVKEDQPSVLLPTAVTGLLAVV